ncbi:MAG: PilZ domain-containing protein [Nitrospiraceae bacterium]
MMPKTKTPTVTDRREWLRIDDRLPLEYRLFGAGAPEGNGAPVTPEHVASLQEFLSQPAHEVAGTLKPDDPQAALIPWMLKMDWALGVVLGTLARMAPEGMTIPRMTDVNISATGISFPSHQHYEPQTKLEIRMILPPFVPLNTAAEVVRTTDAGNHPSGPYVVAVSFVDMRSDDQDCLIRHILQLQAERLRTRQRSVAA